MHIKTKKILVIIFDTICGILVGIYFSNVLTSDTTRRLALASWIIIFIFRIIFDWRSITPEEEYYDNMMKFKMEEARNNLELQAALHKKILAAVEAGDDAKYVTLNEMYRRIG